MYQLHFWFVAIITCILTFLCSLLNPDGWILFLISIILFVVGIYDILQVRSNILRNYPVIGHLRYILLFIRPEIRQYFMESEQDGTPFSAELRHIVYARSSNLMGSLPFGTELDIHRSGYEWLNHSIQPKVLPTSESRILFGEDNCEQPYLSSRLNISAMSFGALSQSAILALNLGAKIGNFAHNTGEGGITPYHLQHKGDLIMQLGTAYFGCRTKDGNFCRKLFQDKANLPNVKMIEIKISQGAKPGHGGMLPASKITAEIANIRGIAADKDCISPAYHSEFSNPIELLNFIAELRLMSHGKPVGFKLCMGNKIEFMNICKAIYKSNKYPDFITIDGAEGGTGAAPLEFTDFIGMPLNEGLSFAHNCLVGANLRKNIRLIASGKIITGFDMLCKIALGADVCNSARGMMFALGCVQSRSCHNNTCPTGITTQNPSRWRAIDVDSKGRYVANFHHATMRSCLEVAGANGLDSLSKMHPSSIYRRISQTQVSDYDKIYSILRPGELLKGTAPQDIQDLWNIADGESFI